MRSVHVETARSRAVGLAVWFALLAGVGLTVLVGVGIALGSSAQSGQPLAETLVFSFFIFGTWLPVTVIAPAVGGVAAVVLAGPGRDVAARIRVAIYVAAFGLCSAAATAICFFVFSPFVLPGIAATSIALCGGAFTGWALAALTFTSANRAS